MFDVLIMWSDDQFMFFSKVGMQGADCLAAALNREMHIVSQGMCRLKADRDTSVYRAN